MYNAEPAEAKGETCCCISPSALVLSYRNQCSSLPRSASPVHSLNSALKSADTHSRRKIARLSIWCRRSAGATSEKWESCVSGSLDPCRSAGQALIRLDLLAGHIHHTNSSQSSRCSSRGRGQAWPASGTPRMQPGRSSIGSETRRLLRQDTASSARPGGKVWEGTSLLGIKISYFELTLVLA